MTLDEYRADKERMKWAAVFAASAARDGDVVALARDLAGNGHMGKHVACPSCAVVALYLEVEVSIKERVV